LFEDASMAQQALANELMWRQDQFGMQLAAHA